MVGFQSGKITQDAYRQRRDETTLQELAALTADPAFDAWQLSKSARDNRARVASNALALAGCVLLIVTMALLKPAAVSQVRGNGSRGGRTAHITLTMGGPALRHLWDVHPCNVIFMMPPADGTHSFCLR
jgi:hypothetical protein